LFCTADLKNNRGKTMREKEVILEKKEAVAYITLNKPRVKNSMGKNTLLELLAALEDINKEPRIAVVILRGAGVDFCSGMDLNEVPAPYGPGAAEFTALADQVFTGIHQCKKITIAVVRGICMAGGLEIALGCDFIIAAKDCRIGDGHIRLPGFTPNGGASASLPQLIGLKKAKRLLLTGELINGEEAERIGLVDFSVATSELDKAIENFLSKFVDKSPIGLAYMKSLINESMGVTFEAGLKKEHEIMEIMGQTEDLKEALAARLEKRKPIYQGK
jgi:enoyl-CoA hydratase/carnithine racemase